MCIYVFPLHRRCDDPVDAKLEDVSLVLEWFFYYKECYFLMTSQHLAEILSMAINTEPSFFQETVSDSEVEGSFRSLFMKLAGAVRAELQLFLKNMQFDSSWAS